MVVFTEVLGPKEMPPNNVFGFETLSSSRLPQSVMAMMNGVENRQGQVFGRFQPLSNRYDVSSSTTSRGILMAY